MEQIAIYIVLGVAIITISSLGTHSYHLSKKNTQLESDLHNALSDLSEANFRYGLLKEIYKANKENNDKARNTGLDGE